MRIELGGIPIEIETHFHDLSRLFDPFVTEKELKAVAGVSWEQIEARRSNHREGMPDGLVEFNELPQCVSDVLLPYDRCLYHGAAFIWREKAWIMTAPSGTGKSTQYVMWKLRYGDELRILNGDKPLLQFGEFATWVHPSPWAGKEGMGRMESAPLGGIICLSQARENKMRQLSSAEAIPRLFVQFLYSGGESETRLVCRKLEQLVHQVPVWSLENLGDNASVELAHDTLSEWMERCGE